MGHYLSLLALQTIILNLSKFPRYSSTMRFPFLDVGINNKRGDRVSSLYFIETNILVDLVEAALGINVF